jgi:hypothetical protein
MRIGIIIGTISIMLMTSANAFTADRTYQGKIIDAETKEPIEGAVVVAVWLEQRAGIPEATTRLKDVKETLTDRDGKWSIVGPEGYEDKIIPGMLQLLGIYATRTPNFIIFKPGYCSWPNGFSIDACKGKIKPGGNGKIREGETVELPKLTKREDRIRAQSISLPAGEHADEKCRELIRLINEERRNLGLGEIYK